MNVPNLLRENTKEGMIGSEGLFIGKICAANGIHVNSKWYEHQAQPVIENDACKILWDFNVQTDHFITARRPDIIFIDKEHHEAK